MLSESQTSIFTLSNGLSTINTNKDIFNAEDLLTNDQGEASFIGAFNGRNPQMCVKQQLFVNKICVKQ